MPSLQVRNLPDALYQKLARAAAREHRSIAQQAVILLSKGLDCELDPKKQRNLLLESLKTGNSIVEEYPLSDPVASIRKDRDR